MQRGALINQISFNVNIFDAFVSLFQNAKKKVDDATGVIPDTESSSWSSDTDKEIQKRFVLTERPSQIKPKEDGELTPEMQNNLILFFRFMVGIAITQGLYLLLTYHSRWQSSKAAWACGFWGFSVATMMAYSKGVRAVVFLMLPSFCTGKGRSILLTYCVMMLINGPGANIMYNYQVMSKSLLCGDELGYNVSKGLQSIVEDAQYAVLDTMDDTVDIVMDAVEVAEEIYTNFAEKVDGIAEVIKTLNDFIRGIGDICSSKLGEFFCIIPRFVAKQAKHLITEPLNRAVEKIKQEFYFTMTFDHKFEYTANASKSIEEISEKFVSEINDRISFLTNTLHWTQFVMGFSTILVVIKAMSYRKKYLTKDDFDNNYITDLFIHLDKKRAKHGQASILPLKPVETRTYHPPNRIIMSKAEMKKFFKSMSFVSFNLTYTAAVVFIDYTFWYIMRELTLTLSVKRRAKNMLDAVLTEGSKKLAASLGGGAHAQKAASAIVQLKVLGDGFVPIIYRAIATSLEKLVKSQGYDMSIDKCLPEPRRPDYVTYVLLGILFLSCYVMCFMEGYALRTRRTIMIQFYPQRERARILYLRTKIITGRGVMDTMSTSIRQAFFQIESDKKKEKISILAHWANKKGCIGWIARHATGKTEHRCRVCGLAGDENEKDLFQMCTRPGCGTEFCVVCFDDLHRICPVCMMRHSKQPMKKKLQKIGRKTEFDTIAEEIMESSGISDSSEESEEDDLVEGDQNYVDLETGKRKITKGGYVKLPASNVRSRKFYSSTSGSSSYSNKAKTEMDNLLDSSDDDF